MKKPYIYKGITDKMENNMNEVVDDLKQIKKYYGENMMHLCRTLFPTILETPGLLLSLMLANFEPNHLLYEDLDVYGKTTDFKNLIYSYLERKKAEQEKQYKDIKTPEQLLEEAGYTLFSECQTEEDIQSFKKYYAKNEELCTFSGDRLNRCRVFFAVKKNVDEIVREKFAIPERQDEYGTSVLSIQFTKDGSNTLSIKNRYNHRVANPDATFSNNLDNIIEGLTESFEVHYGIKQTHLNEFELKGYVRASDGKYYKYNYEVDNVYYCPNNIIIDNFEVKRLEKEKYIVIDYFIIDLVNKKINLYDGLLKRLKDNGDEEPDSFIYSITDIEKINIIKEGDIKKIIISSNGKEDVIITIDKNNRITGLINNNIEEVGNNFLCINETISKIELKKLKKTGKSFLEYNRSLTSIEFPSLEEVGDDFLSENTYILEAILPNLEIVGKNFICFGKALNHIYCPRVRIVGEYFLSDNNSLTSIEFPCLEKIDDHFLHVNEKLTRIEMPSLNQIGHKQSFLSKIDIELKLKIVEILNANQSLKTK